MSEEVINRRSAIGKMVGIAAMLGSTDTVLALADQNGGAENVYVIPGLNRDLEPEAGTQPRYVRQVDHRLNLDNVVDYRLARMKSVFSIAGDTSYLTHVTRHFLCPPGVPPIYFVAEVSLVTVFLEQPDPTSQKITTRAQMTRVLLDPVSFEPIDEIYNPVIGRNIQLPNTLFAISGSIDMSDDAAPEPLLQIEEPYFRFGDSVHLVMLDVRAGEGFHQPRVDSYLWKVKERDLLDPRVRKIRAEVSYSALMRASVFQWTEIPKDDPTQVLSMRAGFKTNDKSDLPEMVTKHILSRYPERA